MNSCYYMQRSLVSLENMTNNFYIHIDADAFFTSVEQCIHRELRGKPVVTGRDGSIAVAMSYEAKDLGVERATPIHIIRKDFPSVHMVASDYFMYKIYSDRMLSIIKNHIPSIQRKSIDECSGEITSMVDSFEQAQALGINIKSELEYKLQCSFSFGISSSPLLAKMASGMNKPSGLTIIDVDTNKDYLLFPIKKVSGLGKRLCERLSRLGVITIGDFIKKYPVIKKNFSIVTDDIFYQLQGHPPTRFSSQGLQKSMNKARSFKVSNNKSEVFGQLILNLESLLRKIRFQNMYCIKVSISLCNAQRVSCSNYLNLTTHSRDPLIIRDCVKKLFDKLYCLDDAYRYVSVTLSGLQQDVYTQNDLFGESENLKSNEKLYNLIDALDYKFGNHCLAPASTLIVPKKIGSHIKKGNEIITELNPLLPNETFFKRLAYPFLGSIS